MSRPILAAVLAGCAAVLAGSLLRGPLAAAAFGAGAVVVPGALAALALRRRPALAAAAFASIGLLVGGALALAAAASRGGWPWRPGGALPLSLVAALLGVWLVPLVVTGVLHARAPRGGVRPRPGRKDGA